MDNFLDQEFILKYQEFFSKEKYTLDKIKKFINKDKTNLYYRKNYQGHITASAILLFDKKILLIYHNFLNKWLFPGGHIDENDINIWDGAKREAIEETGIKNFKLLNWHEINKYIPLDIDIHSIPKNDKKLEEQHLHYDFKYVFILDGLPKINLAHNEVSQFQWIDYKNLPKGKLFDRLSKKLIDLI